MGGYRDLGVGGQGHLRSKVMMGNKSLYMVSYLLLIVTICLGSTIKELQQFESTCIVTLE